MTVTERLLALWDHLGIGRAHVATQMTGDIAGLAGLAGLAAAAERLARPDACRAIPS